MYMQLHGHLTYPLKQYDVGLARILLDVHGHNSNNDNDKQSWMKMERVIARNL